MPGGTAGRGSAVSRKWFSIGGQLMCTVADLIACDWERNATGRAFSGLRVVFRAEPDPAFSQSAAVVTGGNSNDSGHGEGGLN